VAPTVTSIRGAIAQPLLRVAVPAEAEAEVAARDGVVIARTAAVVLLIVRLHYDGANRNLQMRGRQDMCGRRACA